MVSIEHCKANIWHNVSLDNWCTNVSLSLCELTNWWLAMQIIPASKLAYIHEITNQMIDHLLSVREWSDRKSCIAKPYALLLRLRTHFITCVYGRVSIIIAISFVRLLSDTKHTAVFGSRLAPLASCWNIYCAIWLVISMALTQKCLIFNVSPGWVLNTNGSNRSHHRNVVLGFIESNSTWYLNEGKCIVWYIW